MSSSRFVAILGPLAITLVVLGCAANIPLAIREPAPPLTVAQVQQDPEAAIGQRVRWGGSILAVRNQPSHTEIDVLARPLGADGEPRATADPLGRFTARFEGFLDPAEYPKDRRLTVSGPVSAVEVRNIGDYPYHYPVVAATQRYLWPEREAPDPVIYGSGWWGWGGPYWPYAGPFYGPVYRPWHGYW